MTKAARIPQPWEGRPIVENIMLTLPRPPSVNNLLFNVAGKGRMKTDHYRKWMWDAGTYMMAQRITGRIRDFYHLELIVERSNRSPDLDNLLKATNDILKRWGLSLDDKYCQSLEARWLGKGTEMSVRITSTKEQ